MKFKDLLDVLDSDEQLRVTVTNEWGDKVYYGALEQFREEPIFLDLIVKADRVYTRIVEDDEHFDICSNRKALTTEIDVTLYDYEHKIIYFEDDE